MAKRKVKTLDDIKLDMSILYDAVEDGTTELKTAAELANIAGKYLKAEQLELARAIFMGSLGRKVEGATIQAQPSALELLKSAG